LLSPNTLQNNLVPSPTTGLAGTLMPKPTDAA